MFNTSTDLDALDEVFGYVAGDFRRLEQQQQYRLDPGAWALDKLGVYFHEKQDEVGDALVFHRNVAVAAGHGTGKDLTLGTPILTVDRGWTTMGEIRIGDRVFDEAGKPCNVVGKSEIFHLPLFEVTFSDGATVRTSASHEWNTIDHAAAKKARRTTGVADWRDHWDASVTRETGEIAESVWYQNGGKPGANHIVPIAGALEYPEASLPLPPYVTGAWLGDGTSIRPEMTIGDDGLYIIEEFAKDGYTLTKTAKGAYRYTFARQGARELLREANLMANKHIPEAYFTASVHQRRELLRGLMDTDGFVGGFAGVGSVCGIDLASEVLAHDVVRLIRSLGVRASITIAPATMSGRTVGTRHRIVFNPIESPFTPGQYKDAKFQQRNAAQGSRRTMRTIVSVEPVESEPTMCIRVDSPRNLYLATEHLIPTHNSFQAALLACWWVDTHPLGSAYVATTAPTNDQISEIIFREVKAIHALSAERVNKGLIRPEEGLQGRVGEDNTWKIERGGRLVTVMKGRKPPDNKAGDAFQGIHARYVLAIGDEATGLSEEMIDGLANITSNDNSRRLLISNPTNPYSALGRIFLKPAVDDAGVEAWKKIHVSVFDLPTFHGGGRCKCADHVGKPLGLGYPKEMLESLSGPQFVKDKKAEYGEDSARYRSRVLGQFAFEAGSNLFTDREMNTAVDTIVSEDFDLRPWLGVDVARFGEDMSVVYRADRGTVMERVLDDEGAPTSQIVPKLDEEGYPIAGVKVRYVESWRNAPLVTKLRPDGTEEMGTAERVHQIAMSIGAESVRVDVSGVGGGVVDRLWTLSNAGSLYQIVEVLGGAASPDRRRWLNDRAFQMDGNLRQKMFSGQLDLDPRDEELLDQLSGIQYDFADGSAGGGLKIESKESMKRAGRKSPDFVDACYYSCMALGDTHMPGDVISTDLDVIVSGSGRDWFFNAPAGAL